MSYRVKVSGKIFEGDDFRTLLRRAVRAKREASPAVARACTSHQGSSREAEKGILASISNWPTR